MLPLDEVKPFHFLKHRYTSSHTDTVFSLIESSVDSGEMVVFIESYRWKCELNNEECRTKNEDLISHFAISSLWRGGSGSVRGGPFQ